MEKKLLHDKEGGAVQTYEVLRFDPPPPVKSLAPTEEEIKARIAAMEEEGRARGQAKGYEEGLAKGEREVREKIKRISRIEGLIVELEHYRERRLEDLLPEFVELALEMARKVVAREIALDPSVVLDVAADAIKKVGEKEERIVIKVNPQDHDILVKNLDLLKSGTSLKAISLEPSKEIRPGGCYIEASAGEIDARVEEKTKELESVVRTATDSEV